MRVFHRAVSLAAVVVAAAAAAAAPSPVAAAGARDTAWWNTSLLRPPAYTAGFTRSSVYVTLPDHARIAVDEYLPRGVKPGVKLPTILSQTRYLRSVQFTPAAGGGCHFADSGIEAYVKFLTAYGYAYVVSDVRGTGASFGFQPTEISPQEVIDGSNLVDWIVAQPWSNGRIGTTGISYVGYTAEELLAEQNPHVLAAAPLFDGFDPYKELFFAGGTENAGFDTTWSAANRILDVGDVSLLDPKWLQPCPVDGDPQGLLLAKARKQHLRSNNIGAAYPKIRFRDDRVFGYTVDDSSPFKYRFLIDAAPAAIYALGGQDDSGYVSGLVNRFINAPAGRMRMTIGPWAHAGIYYYAPGVHGVVRSKFDQLAEVLRFFDDALLGLDDVGFAEQPLVHYFTTGLEQWQNANVWPPVAMKATRFAFAPAHALVPEKSAVAQGADRYRIDLSTTTGPNARWHTTLGGYPVVYPDRAQADQQLLTYTTAPLKHALEVTGEAYVSVYLTSTQPDFELFAYLEDVAPNGEVNYVTEGELLYQHARPGPLPYLALSPSHSELKGDRLPPLGPDQLAEMTVSLIADSHLFKRGHHVRIALAGADSTYFVPPSFPPAHLAVFFGGATASGVTLPAAEKPALDGLR